MLKKLPENWAKTGKFMENEFFKNCNFLIISLTVTNQRLETFAQYEISI